VEASEGEDGQETGGNQTGSPAFRGQSGLALEMNLEVVTRRRQSALRILKRAALGQGFAQLFAETSAIAKDRENSFEAQLGFFTGC